MGKKLGLRTKTCSSGCVRGCSSCGSVIDNKITRIRVFRGTKNRRYGR